MLGVYVPQMSKNLPEIVHNFYGQALGVFQMEKQENKNETVKTCIFRLVLFS